jgi:hypothetical protein
MLTIRRSSTSLTKQTPIMLISKYNPPCLSEHRIVSMVEALNLSTLKDLQTEIQQKTDLLDLVATLSDQISREKKDITVSKSGMKERGG